jgi:hypothetical protein
MEKADGETSEVEMDAKDRAWLLEATAGDEAVLDDMLAYIRDEWHVTPKQIAQAVREFDPKRPTEGLRLLSLIPGAWRTGTGRLLLIVAGNKALCIERLEQRRSASGERGH